FELVKDGKRAAEASTADAVTSREGGAGVRRVVVAAQPTSSAGAAERVAGAMAFEDPDDFDAAEKKKLTVLQRVSKLNVGQRIKLGFIGGKEERALLIRDTARLVQNAVLSSPKLTDAEAEL